MCTGLGDETQGRRGRTMASISDNSIGDWSLCSFLLDLSHWALEHFSASVLTQASVKD